MEVPLDDPEPLPARAGTELSDFPDLAEPPEALDDRKASTWREMARVAQDLLALPASARMETIRAAAPEGVPAGALVLCIRQLTRDGRIEEAELLEHYLCGAVGLLAKPRYRYLGALRARALKATPAGQGRFDGEDLFQDAVVRILDKLHTNSSAVTAWPSFTFGRLGEAQRTAAGRTGEKLRRERIESSFATTNDGDLDGSILDGVFEDPPVAGTVDPDLEELVQEVLEGICEAAPEPERTVLCLLWLSNEKPRSVNQIAAELGLKPDRVRNMRLDAGKKALEVIGARGHPAVGAAALANVWSRLPSRRGSKPPPARSS